MPETAMPLEGCATHEHGYGVLVAMLMIECQRSLEFFNGGCGLMGAGFFV